VAHPETGELVTIGQLARVHTVEALETLVELMRQPDDPKLRMLAAEAVLSRGWGRAPELHAITGETGPVQLRVVANLGPPPAEPQAATTASAPVTLEPEAASDPPAPVQDTAEPAPVLDTAEQAALRDAGYDVDHDGPPVKRFFPGQF
jgi:hypothetical protein